MISKKFILKKAIQIVLHVVFWIGVLFFYTHFFGYESSNFNYVFSFSAFLMPVTIITTYVVIYYLIPKYVLLKKYGLLILYSTYTFVLSAYLIIISIFYGLIFLSGFKPNGMAPMSKSLLVVMIAVYIIVVLVGAFSLVKHNYKSNSTNQELQHKVLETQLKLKEQELHYLKMQIHPHFLFNTLNTMYGFALKKSEETPEMILRLSNLLDYLLYQVDKPLVPLKQELDHIKDYVTLEKMRFNDTLDVTMNFEDVDDSIHIAPMLLIPFVENSFKHGQIRNKKLSVYMKLTHINSIVHFSIQNSVYISSKNDPDGIGLSNIKKRLTSLYEDNYELLISKDEQWYSVELKLNTSKTKNL